MQKCTIHVQRTEPRHVLGPHRAIRSQSVEGLEEHVSLLASVFCLTEFRGRAGGATDPARWWEHRTAALAVFFILREGKQRADLDTLLPAAARALADARSLKIINACLLPLRGCSLAVRLSGQAAFQGRTSRRMRCRPFARFYARGVSPDNTRSQRCVRFPWRSVVR